MSAVFLAQVLETSIQFLKSTLDASLWNVVIRISGGSLRIGDSRNSRSVALVGDSGSSGTEGTPKDDCESFFCMTNESPSSYGARSGDVEEEETEVASLTSAASPRCRVIA